MATNQSTYFGFPQMQDNNETDPSKLADTTTLTGAIAGLSKAAINGIANGVGRIWNTGAPTTTMEQRNADFPAQNLKRYDTPGGSPFSLPVASAATIALPAPSRATAVTPSGYPAPVDSGPTLQAGYMANPNPLPVPRRGGARAIAASATLQPVTPDAPSAPAGPGPMVSDVSSRFSQGSGPVRPFDAQGAALSGNSGDFSYSADGTNGGFGATTNPDGSIKMLALRQRTAAEDVAHPQEFQPTAPAAPVLRPGDPGWTGSQAAWEHDQQFANMGPMSAAQRAAIIQKDQEIKDLYAHNTMADSTALLGARALAGHYGTLDRETGALLPGKVGLQGSELATAATTRDQMRNNMAIATAKLGPEIAVLNSTANLHDVSAARLASMTPAEIYALTATADYHTAMGKSVQDKGEAAMERVRQADYNNGSKAYDEALKANPNDRAGAALAMYDSINTAAQTRAGNVPTYTSGAKAKTVPWYLPGASTPATTPTVTWGPKSAVAGGVQIPKTALAALPKNADGTVTYNGAKYRVQ